MSDQSNDHIAQPPTADTARTETAAGQHTRHATSSAAGPFAAYRRVEWVRAGDLVQRTGTRLIEQGALTHLQLRQMLAAARHDGTRYLRTALRDRASNLDADAPTSTAAGHSMERERIVR
jgi:hypothetical protein